MEHSGWPASPPRTRPARGSHLGIRFKSRFSFRGSGAGLGVCISDKPRSPRPRLIDLEPKQKKRVGTRATPRATRWTGSPQGDEG